jgi:hypothetical protein
MTNNINSIYADGGDNVVASDDHQIFCDSIGVHHRQHPNAIGSCVESAAAIFLNTDTTSSIPLAIKHIYTQLGATATTIEGGVPDFQLTLIGDDTNGYGLKLDQINRRQFEDELIQMLRQCHIWLITSGMVCNQLSTIAARSIIRVRDQHSCTDSIIFAVNSSKIVSYRGGIQQQYQVNIYKYLLMMVVF